MYKHQMVTNLKWCDLFALAIFAMCLSAFSVSCVALPAYV